MSSVTINNEIKMTVPDSFAEMGEEDLARYFSTAQNRWGVYDADRHIILSVSWSKAKPLADAESVVYGVEARMRRNLLNYQQISEFKMKIASKKAYGVRFSYRVNDARIVQIGDFITFKHKKLFYAIHFITRQATAAEDRAILKEAIESISLS